MQTISVLYEQKVFHATKLGRLQLAQQTIAELVRWSAGQLDFHNIVKFKYSASILVNGTGHQQQEQEHGQELGNDGMAKRPTFDALILLLHRSITWEQTSEIVARLTRRLMTTNITLTIDAQPGQQQTTAQIAGLVAVLACVWLQCWPL